MRTLLLTTALICASIPAYAEQVCQPTADAIASLKKAGAKQIWSGISDDRTLMVLWQAADGSRWVWTYVYSDGTVMCGIDTGHDGQLLLKENKESKEGSGI